MQIGLADRREAHRWRARQHRRHEGFAAHEAPANDIQVQHELEFVAASDDDEN